MCFVPRKGYSVHMVNVLKFKDTINHLFNEKIQIKAPVLNVTKKQILGKNCSQKKQNVCPIKFF